MNADKLLVFNQRLDHFRRSSACCQAGLGRRVTSLSGERLRGAAILTGMRLVDRYGFQQRFRVRCYATWEHFEDLACVADIGEGIGVEEDQVRQLAVATPVQAASIGIPAWVHESGEFGNPAVMVVPSPPQPF